MRPEVAPDLMNADFMRPQPPLSNHQQVLDTFEMYCADPLIPGETDLRHIEGAGNIAVTTSEEEGSRTALTEAFDEIAKSGAALRRILDAVPQIVVVLGASGDFLYGNQLALEYGVLTIEDVGSGKGSELPLPDNSVRLREELAAAFSRGIPFEKERRFLRRDGQYRWLLVQYKPLLNDRGEVIRWYTTGTNIDGRKRAEEKLRRSEWNLLEAQRLGHTWNIDIASRAMTGSTELLRSIGLKPGADSSRKHFDCDKIHPEDRNRNLGKFTGVASGRLSGGQGCSH